MHTGYDNYWMYHNRRHELVLCLPKNDNFSHPVCTDNYKQVQGMGNPSNMYNYVPHPNTVARPLQKVPNDQHRVTSTQSMWPSSVCLQPYSSSQTLNYLPQEVRSVQPNNLCDSSPPQQNQVLRNAENCNINFNPGQTVNYKASAGPVNNQDSYNYKAQTARIRVKDISLLNNDKNNNYNPLLEASLPQVQQKKQHYYPFDAAVVGQNRLYDNGQTQREGANYGSTVMSEMNHSYQNYGPPTGHNFHRTDEEQYAQPSPAFYQQNAQFLCERQPGFNNIQQKSSPKKPPQDFKRGIYSTPSGKNLNRNVFREANQQHIQLNPEEYSGNNASGASDANAFNLSGLPNSNEINASSQIQPALSETIQASLLNPITAANKSRSEVITKSPLHNPLIGQETSTFRTTIPSPTQSAAGRKDPSFSEPSRNSDLSLPSQNSFGGTLRCCFPRDEAKAQNEAGKASEGNGEFSGSRNSGGSQLFDQQEPVPGSHKGNRNLPPENQRGHGRGHKETVIVFHGKRALDCSKKPKVENLNAEKDSSEKENAVCPEGAAVHTIKSQVDVFAQNRKTEQLSDPNILEGTEPSVAENVENVDLHRSKPPEAKCKTAPAGSNTCHESKIQDVIVGGRANCFEKPITIEDTAKAQEAVGGEEVSVIVEGKCKSEINRDKLDLLIKFLKKDGVEPIECETLAENDYSPSSAEPREERVQKQNRRKLSKTCIVKNKNTEREMISLVSYKTPKNSARVSSTKNSPVESGETKNTGGKDGPAAEDFAYSGNNGQTVPNEKRAEKNNDNLSGGKQKAINMPSEGKSTKETTDNCSSDEKGITTEERNVINVMRAFQNLKNHFCASCDFTSPVESIWINVVSGELRCLNCFKKMVLKAEESTGNSKKCAGDGASTLKALGRNADEEGGGRRSEGAKNLEKKSNREDEVPAKEAFISEELRQHVKEEVGKSEYVSGALNKEEAVNRVSGKEQCDPRKAQGSDEEVRAETKTRGEKSARGNSTEEHVPEKMTKKGGKQGPDSRDGKRSHSIEEVVPRKVHIVEEDEKESKTIRRDRPMSKSLPKESSNSYRTSEEDAKKMRKHEARNESKVPYSMEGCIEKRCKTEHSKMKECKAEHEPKRKGDELLEKPKRRKTSSDEEIDPKKIRSKEEHSQRKKQKVKHSSGRLNMRRESKENGEKDKMMEERAKDWTGKARRNSTPKEDSPSQDGYEKDSKEESELADLCKPKRRSTLSQRRRAKAETLDPTYVPPNRLAFDGRKPSKAKKKTEDFDPQESHPPKNQKKDSKLEGFPWENDKAKQEQRTKHYSQKMHEVSDSEKSPQRKPADKHYRTSKQCLISRLFKGKQNTTVSPNSKTADGEPHKTHEHRKEHRRQDESRETDSEENNCHSQSRAKSSHRAAESSSEKRRHSGEEPTDGRRHHANGRNVSAMDRSSPKDKAVGCIFGAIMKEGGSLQSNNLDDVTYSTALLARLMKKTKKLSWSLLGET